MRSTMTTTIMLSALLSMWAANAHAQSQDQPVPERCKVDPAQPGNGEGLPADPSPPESLTDKLDDCNAVLAPPAVGDGEIVTPPPNVGTMPVIRPDEVPPQNGSEPQ